MTPAPHIYNFSNYRAFLKAWLGFESQKKDGYTLRSLAKDAKLDAGHLSRVIKASRPLTRKMFQKLAHVLKFSYSEKKYFWLLVELSDSNTIDERENAFKKISKNPAYKVRYQEEVNTHKMLGSWYYVVIWQLADLPDFKFDAKWIKNQIQHDVSLSEIKTCMDFLIREGYWISTQAGRIQPIQKPFRIDQEILHMAMAHWHRQYMDLAAKSIDVTPRDERHLLTYTLPLPVNCFGEIKKILESTISQIQEVSKSIPPSEHDSVYNVALYSFPLAKIRKVK